MRLGSSVSVTDGPRGDKNSGSRGKLDSQSEIEQNEVPTKGGVIGSACKDGAQAIGNVAAIHVLQSHDPGTAVEGTGGEYAGIEGLLQAGVPLKQGLYIVSIAHV